MKIEYIIIAHVKFIKRNMKNIHMILILCKCSFMMNMSLFKRHGNYQLLKEDLDTPEQDKTAIPKFQLLEPELKEFSISFENASSACYYIIHIVKDSIYAYHSPKMKLLFISHIDKQMNFLIEARKSALKFEVFEYEMHKLCELILQVLLNLMKNEPRKNLKLFIDFLNCEIMPIMKRIHHTLITKKSICKKNMKLKFRKSKDKKIDNDERLELLYNFCINQLVSKKSNHLVIKKEDFQINDLLAFCSNAFVRSYLLVKKNMNEYYSEFITPENPITTQFRDLLFLNGLITKLICIVRKKIDDYLIHYQNSLRTYLLIKQKIIPELDYLNTIASWLGEAQVLLKRRRTPLREEEIKKL